MPIKWHRCGKNIADDAEIERCYNDIVPHWIVRYGFDGQILSYGGFYMKYCPYCGAPLQDSAASFCSECGQKLVPVQEEGCSEQKKKRFPPFLRAKKQKQQASDPVVSEQEPAPPDDALLDAEADRNYDGYYDDILPTDLGKKREPVDRSLVIKILLLCAGVFLIISACVVALYLL